MKSGIEVDDAKQEKLKGGYCVCYCDIGFITFNAERRGVSGSHCACTCSQEAIGTADSRMSQY